MNAVVHLQAALDEIDSETSELQHRLAELAAMRAALVPIINGHARVEPGPGIKELAAKAKPTLAPKRGRAATLTCDTCGKNFGSNVALGVHRSKAHGIAGPNNKLAQRPPVDADTLPALADRPKQTWTPAPGEIVLRCQEDGCDHVEPITGVTALNRHCLANHRRAASVDERRPTPWEGAA